MGVKTNVLDTGQISQGSGLWLGTLRRYLLFVLAVNLVWETLHLPLYTIWFEDTPGALAFAVVHCTGGDVLIALSSVMLALILVGNNAWPLIRFGPVALLTVLFGVTYTVFSEWLNIVVRKSWAYSEYMSVIPVIDAGLSPVAQWIVIPAVGLWWCWSWTKRVRS
jgi:hypothetical protein